MKVVHVSANDVKGGAARAAYRLHQGLRQLGHESLLYVSGRSSYDDPSVVKFAAPMGIPARVRRAWRRRSIAADFDRYSRSRPSGLESFSDDRAPFGRAFMAQLPACDVINLHWVAGFLDYGTFFSAVPRHIPVVWRLADMNPLTGGCHYDDGCGRFEDACGSCPQLGSSARRDLSYRILQRKKAALAGGDGCRLHIVTLCRWMTERVRRSALLRDIPVTMIPNGIDLTEFQPRDRGFSRQLLGVPQDAKVVLFIADGATNKRKGFALLAEALEHLSTENVFLLSAGSGKPRVKGGFPHLHLGPVGYRWLSVVYSAADLFVIPSVEDNLPNTVLESMACGTPVVGFDIGGIPDMVREGSTGFLVPRADVRALRAAIQGLLGNADVRRQMGHACRAVASRDYPLDLQARRYSDLYQFLMAAATEGATNGGNTRSQSPALVLGEPHR